MPEFNEHPSEDQLLVYIDGDSIEREEIESHIALCKECAEFVSSIGQAERYAKIAPRIENPAQTQEKIAIMRRIIEEQLRDGPDSPRPEEAPKQQDSQAERIESPKDASYEPMVKHSLEPSRSTTNTHFWTRSRTALALAVAASLLFVLILNWPTSSSSAIVGLDIELRESELLDGGSDRKMRPTLSIALQHPPSGTATVAVASRSAQEITYHDSAIEIPSDQATWIYPRPDEPGGIIQPTAGGFVVVIIAKERLPDKFLNQLDLHKDASYRQVQEKITNVLREKKINVVGVGVKEIEPLQN